VVLPTYTSDDGAAVPATQKLKHYADPAGHVPLWTAGDMRVSVYPPHPDGTGSGAGQGAGVSMCGKDQPEVLRLLPEHHHAASLHPDISQTHHIAMNEESVQLPFAFSRSAGQHGSDFVRFPEDYNGVGCYGSAVLGILKAAGYKVQWVDGGNSHDDAIYARASAAPTSEHLPGSAAYSACQCVHGSNSPAVYRFSTYLNKYGSFGPSLPPRVRLTTPLLCHSSLYKDAY
jgi:hypothetical protein